MFFFPPLKIDLGKPYREGGFVLCRACAAPQAGPASGVLARAVLAEEQQRRSGSRAQGAPRAELCSRIPSFCLFQLNCSDRAPSCQQKEGFFFSQLHKEAVRPCCSCNLSPAQLTKMYKSGNEHLSYQFSSHFL